MTINATTAAQLANFKPTVTPQSDPLGSTPTPEELKEMKALEQGYLRLVDSIVKSTGNANWTGWNWRENDTT